MAESQNYYSEEAKKYTLYDSVYMKLEYKTSTQ